MPASPLSPFVAELRCLRCGRPHPADAAAYLCPSCGAGNERDPGILDVVYDYGAARSGFPPQADGEGDVFRYQALLPLAAPRATGLRAGGTPLVAAPGLARRYGLAELWLKDETANPTRCLKDRATALGIALARAAGHHTLYCASAGNAGISLAGFCANAGLGCHVWVPADASPRRLDWLRRFGAEVHRVEEGYDAAFDQAEAVGHGRGWYSRNCAYNPFLVEGKKTVSFELAEQLGGTPDLVVAPVGDGCTLGAIGKGFRELREIGRGERIPRLLGVQAENVQPLVRRLRGKPAAENGSTRAASIAVRHPRNALRLLRELEASGGTLLPVPDAEMDQAAGLLAREAGMVCELTSAATLAALARLAATESLAGQRAVLVITGGRVD